MGPIFFACWVVEVEFPSLFRFYSGLTKFITTHPRKSLYKCTRQGQIPGWGGSVCVCVWGGGSDIFYIHWLGRFFGGRNFQFQYFGAFKKITIFF